VTSAFLGLERPPNVAELHHWADYVELNCMASVDHIYNPGQLAAHIRRAKDSGEATEESTQGDPVLDAEAMDALLGIFEEDEDIRESGTSWDQDLDEETDDVGQTLTGGPLSDSFTRRVDDIWLYLRYRAASFGDAWPFEVDPITSTLSFREPDTDQQRLYIFLLLCSSLRYKPSMLSPLTKAFEQVSYEAFAAAFPGWEVHIFGTAAKSGSRYKVGKLWKRLKLLSGDLRSPLVITEDDVKDRDVGDNGLDLVAWLPLPDTSKGFPMAFAQCACGANDWKDKQQEVSEARWGETLKLSNPILNWTFIPFCYHNPQGQWENQRLVYKGILVDRLRLFHLLEARIDQVQAVIGNLDLV
jgi:hypothetical protein